MSTTRMSLVAAAVFAVFGAGATAQPINDRLPLSFEVIHTHNSGQCHGTLTLDKWVFTFVSADRPQDSRTWKLTDIDKVESKTRNELVLRTTESGAATLGQNRNYKFKVLGDGIPPDVVAWMQDRVR